MDEKLYFDLINAALLIAIAIRLIHLNLSRKEFFGGLVISPLFFGFAFALITMGFSDFLRPETENYIRLIVLPLVFLSGFFWISFISGKIFKLPQSDEFRRRNAQLRLEIEARKEAENQLRKVNAMLEERISVRTVELQSIIDASPLSMIRVDEHARVNLWNPAAESLFGWNAEEVIGKPLPTIPPDKVGEFDQVFSATLKGKPLNGIETCRMNKKGERIDVTLWNAPIISSPNTNIKVALAMFADNRERKKVREQLKAALLEAERANRTKTLFLANVGHEIRTPLNAILGFSELLRDNNLGENERAEFLSHIERNGHLLSQLINDLLDISKIEAGHLEIIKEPTDLHQLFEDVYSTQALKAKHKAIRLSFDITKETPQWVETDPLRLRQILINITGNAIKFTKKGYVKVKVDYLENCLSIQVKDTGRGLTELEAGRLFKPFAQAHATVTKTHGGTGLGLYLSRVLAHQLGGNVQLSESTPGMGSVFEIKIEAPPSQQKSVDTQISDERNLLNGKRILVVDDSEENRMIVSRFLSQWGAITELAVNGEEGVKLAMAHNPDALLLDIQMPIKDGYEAIRDLRDQGFNKPAIAMTAFSLKEDRERCLREGFTAHLSKPFSKASLLHSIAATLSQPRLI